MAGKDVSEIYCWKIELDKLNIHMASSKRGAIRLGHGLGRTPECLRYFKEIFPLNRLIKDEKMNLPLIKAVKAVLEGRSVGNLSLDISCTPFQKMVWKQIAGIPFGQTRTYGDVAMMVGRPGGARAIGQTMKRNPLPLIFP